MGLEPDSIHPFMEKSTTAIYQHQDGQLISYGLKKPRNEDILHYQSHMDMYAISTYSRRGDILYKSDIAIKIIVYLGQCFAYKDIARLTVVHLM
nr:hypothetical protein BgiMline_029159 [Biomphalaria glabrata]